MGKGIQSLLVIGQLYCWVRALEQQQFDLMKAATSFTYSYTIALMQVTTNLRGLVRPTMLQTGLDKKFSTKLPSLALLVSRTKFVWISESEGVCVGPRAGVKGL